MNIEEYNRQYGARSFNLHEKNNRRSKVNSKKTIAEEKKKKRKAKIVGIRWDKIIAFVTMIVMIVCSVIIVDDIQGNEINFGSNRVQTQDTNASVMQVTTESAKKVVCIDAGHGGTDCGADSGGKYEKDQTLVIAELVKQYLEEEDISVVMTRTTDATVSLEQRVSVCNNAKSSVMVSIHRNYSENGSSAKGVEAWILNSSPKNSKTLATGILTKLETISGVKNRGLKTGTIANANTNYYINNYSNCASCIIELGFMTNTSDTELVTSNKNQCAKAIAQGIVNYLKGE